MKSTIKNKTRSAVTYDRPATAAGRGIFAEVSVRFGYSLHVFDAAQYHGAGCLADEENGLYDASSVAKRRDC